MNYKELTGGEEAGGREVALINLPNLSQGSNRTKVAFMLAALLVLLLTIVVLVSALHYSKQTDREGNVDVHLTININ